MVTTASNSTPHRVQRPAGLAADVYAQLGHRLDGAGMDLAGRFRSGADGLHGLAAMEAGEALGHLASVGVFDADEQDPVHAPMLHAACPGAKIGA